MFEPVPPESRPPPTEVDQRVLFRGVGWETYEALLAERKKLGAEADECYVVGPVESPEAPDVVIEPARSCILVHRYLEPRAVADRGGGQ